MRGVSATILPVPPPPPKIGSLVKPSRRPHTWRLGVVEAVDEHGVKVRAYVAPPGAYAGTAAHYRHDAIEVVPVEAARRYLEQLRAKIVTARAVLAQDEQDAAQIEEAIAASKE